MSLVRRVERIEFRLEQRQLRRQAERIAHKNGVRVEEVLERARLIGDRLEEYRESGLTQEQALRRLAEDADEDPDDFVARVQRTMEAWS